MDQSVFYADIIFNFIQIVSCIFRIGISH